MPVAFGALQSGLQTLQSPGVFGFECQFGGQTFFAIITELNPVDVEVLLGSDIREASQVTATRGMIPAMDRGQMFTTGTDVFKVVKHVDNPASPAEIYYVVKVIDGKDK